MRKRYLIPIIITLGIIYYFFNPEESILFPKCPFLLVTGYQCPGCGSQRAVHSLLNLDAATAFRHNAFLVLNLPIILVLGYAELKRTTKPRFYRRLHQPPLLIGYFLLVVAWWIGRNYYSSGVSTTTLPLFF